MTEIYGYAPQEIMADPSIFQRVILAEGRQQFDRTLARSAESMTPWAWEGAVQPRRGGTKWVQVRARPRRSHAGEVIWDGIILDVTAAKETETQLLQVQRLEAVGRLTGGIAHDFNNFLTVILANAEFLLEQPGIDEKAAYAARLMRQAAERGAELTQQMLAFSRRQSLMPVVVDLNGLVERMVGLLRRTLGEQVSIRTTLADGLWPTRADLTQLESAILNLAINARDAMPKGGTLTIATANVPASTDVPASRDERDGDFVSLTVSDTGTGMPQEVLARAFEPFFTTKAPGKGTGLGLSMIYGFVKQSGGHINIATEVGRGTSVVILLPRHAGDDLPAANDKAFRVPTQGGGEVVLIAEDDDLVRRSLAEQLRSLGYSVFESSDAAGALARLAELGSIDLLVTDLVMPGGMTGYELAREVRRICPRAAILCTSGYEDPEVVRDGGGNGAFILLRKPYGTAELRERLAAALANRPA